MGFQSKSLRNDARKNIGVAKGLDEALGGISKDVALTAAEAASNAALSVSVDELAEILVELDQRADVRHRQAVKSYNVADSRPLSARAWDAWQAKRMRKKVIKRAARKNTVDIAFTISDDQHLGDFADAIVNNVLPSYKDKRKPPVGVVVR